MTLLDRYNNNVRKLLLDEVEDLCFVYLQDDSVFPTCMTLDEMRNLDRDVLCDSIESVYHREINCSLMQSSDMYEAVDMAMYVLEEIKRDASLSDKAYAVVEHAIDVISNAGQAIIDEYELERAYAIVWRAITEE